MEEAEAFNPLNYPSKFTILLQEQPMKTKTIPEIGFLRLRDVIGAVMVVTGRTAHEIFGSPDDMKLKSSMTLFAHISPEGSAFDRVLDRYFGGHQDRKTIELIRGDQ